MPRPGAMDKRIKSDPDAINWRHTEGNRLVPHEDELPLTNPHKLISGGEYVLSERIYRANIN